MLEPLQYEFFVRGLIAATLVGGLCGLIGVYIVLRRMSYIGHGLSHAIFGGAVVSYVIGINFFIGASLWGFVSALLINQVTRRKRFIASDAAIGIVTTASFAFGIILISRYRTFTRSFDAALFGNILGVDQSDIYAILAMTVAAMAFIVIAYRRLLFTTFDPEVAPFYGVSTEWMDVWFSLILAGTIVVSMQVLGVTLIAAAIVIAPITARLLTHNFNQLIVMSTVIGAMCGFAGLYLSYYIDVSSGASIVLFSAGIFVVALAYSTTRESLNRARSPAAKPRPLPDQAAFE